MFNVTGYIKNTNGDPIPGASVILYDQFGVDMGFGTAANSNGFFTFWANESDPRLPNAILQISSVGYKTKAVDFDTYGGGQTITLETDVITLPPVVIGPGTDDKQKYLWLLAAAGGAFILLNKDKKGRRVNGVAASAVSKFKKLPKPVQYAVYAAAGFGAYKLISMFSRHKNPAVSPDQAAQELPGLPTTQQPTFSDLQYSSWADAIQEQFAGCDYSLGFPWELTASGKTVNNILKQLRTAGDFLKLVTAYGVREYDQCGVWPVSGNFKGNLYQAVADELEASEITWLNETLSSKGITYRF